MALQRAVSCCLLAVGIITCGPTLVEEDAPEQALGSMGQGVCVIADIPQPAPCNVPSIPTQFVCDVITQNTTCDQIANAYYGAVTQLENAICNHHYAGDWLSKLNAAITLWTIARDGSSDYEAAMCAQQHIDYYTERAMMASTMVWWTEMDIACLNNTAAVNQCEFARCLVTPACKPVLTRGNGPGGAGCTDGSECQSGLCLAGSNTCANPPIDYCCLAPTDNRCPNFWQEREACWAFIQMQQGDGGVP